MTERYARTRVARAPACWGRCLSNAAWRRLRSAHWLPKFLPPGFQRDLTPLWKGDHVLKEALARTSRGADITHLWIPTFKAQHTFELG